MVASSRYPATVREVAATLAARYADFDHYNLKDPLDNPVDVDWIETTRNTFMDRRGEGVPIILARSEALSGRLPEYRVIDQSKLLLTIHAAGENAFVQRANSHPC